MSGFEIAGVGLGLVPLVLEAITAYQKARDMLHTFSTYSSAVRDLRLRINTQQRLFHFACRRLLRPLVGNSELSGMLRDSSHSRWQDEEFQDRWRCYLGEDYEICSENLKVINAKLREINEEMSKYFGKLPLDGEDDFLHQLREKISFSFNERKYKEMIEDMDSYVNNLSRIIDQRSSDATNKPTTYFGPEEIPQEFSKINKASRCLHSCLTRAWSCSDTSHVGHKAQLSVYARCNHGVRLDLVLSARQRDVAPAANEPTEQSVWLYVETNVMEMPKSLDAPQSALQEQKIVPKDEDPVKKPGKAQKWKDRVVRFAISFLSPKAGKRRLQDVQRHESLESPRYIDKQAPPALSNKRGLCYSTFDLRHVDSICSHFRRMCTEECLGYLNTEEPSRHVFYSTGRSALGNRQGIMETPLQLNEILEGVSMLQQLQLAHLLATVVLRFHSTPWLAPDWHLKDMSVFGRIPSIEDEDFMQLFNTLHLSVRFPDPNGSVGQQETPPGGNPSADQEPSIAHLHGLGNMTLAHLGIALLEIGYKQEITSFRTSREPHDVVTARRLLEGRPMTLGIPYRNIVRKCVDCDFALGKDLGNVKLQNAVYNDIVCSLERLIENCKKLIVDL